MTEVLYALFAVPVLIHAWWNVSQRPETPKQFHARVLFEFYRWGWMLTGIGAIAALVRGFSDESNVMIDFMCLSLPLGFSAIVMRSWFRSVFDEVGKKKNQNFVCEDPVYESDETVIFRK